MYNSLKILIRRALWIRSLHKLEQESKFITDLFCNLTYPLDIVQLIVYANIAEIRRPKHTGLENDLVFLRLSWIYETDAIFPKQILFNISQ